MVYREANGQLEHDTARIGLKSVFSEIKGLRGARRVKAHGQEDDCRLVLDMVINRITGLPSLLSEAYKTQADLGVQLNVAKSNLALVIANNEILEDAFKRDNSTSSHDVGWHRQSGKHGNMTDERE
ncbi:hypothetical protein AN958_00246 [Leucoagaricus sp. SymC.cos]|nr:hypothetical protein AN958_00246 [Leucoagaricus sp. SymC.cos]